MPEQFHLTELAAEAKREVGQRKWVYRKRVDGGQMTQADALDKIAKMEAIAKLLGDMADAELRKVEPRLDL